MSWGIPIPYAVVNVDGDYRHIYLTRDDVRIDGERTDRSVLDQSVLTLIWRHRALAAEALLRASAEVQP